MTQNRRGLHSTEPWKESCGNKQRKKRVLSGEAVQPAKHSSDEKNTSTKKKKKKSKVAVNSAERMQSLCECFADVSDPRVDRRKRHLLIDIIVIAILAVIANGDQWKDMRIWAEANQQWIASFLALPNGIPSRDTFRRTISRIDPQEFQQAFLRWVKGLQKGMQDVINIDGKSLRGSRQEGQKPLHIVSAWACEQHLTLGQRQVDGKSNEITAIPQLLQMLELKGAIVTIDAMGCQKDIADAIIQGKGDYCLAVKGNQPTLEKEIKESFEAAWNDASQREETQEHDTTEHKRPHGRVESRYYCTMPAPQSLSTRSAWNGLTSIGMTITYRSEGSAPTEEGEYRYYIMSFSSDVKRFAQAVRGHWGIENSLHWVMDVTFGEDASRIRKDHGGENVSWLRRLAITLIKNETNRKDSIRAKRLRAAYDTNYLQEIVSAIPCN